MQLTLNVHQVLVRTQETKTNKLLNVHLHLPFPHRKRGEKWPESRPAHYQYNEYQLVITKVSHKQHLVMGKAKELSQDLHNLIVATLSNF